MVNKTHLLLFVYFRTKSPKKNGYFMLPFASSSATKEKIII